LNTKDHLPNVIATQLAALFEGARDYSLAGKYFLIAAESARSVFAYSESLRLAWHGLGLIRKLRDSPERAAMELSCLLMMGRALLSSKSYAAGEIEFVYSEARDLCQKVGPTLQIYPVVYGLFMYYFSRSGIQDAFRISHQLLRIAKTGQDRVAQIEAHFIHAAPWFLLAAMKPRSDTCERCLSDTIVSIIIPMRLSIS